jgi:endonuclease/exonuclease/phosphatase family metal-dependent hydrolase
MLYSNHGLDRAFDFIAHTDFDVFCLQEVPPAFLERLHTFPYNLASHIDVERPFKEGFVRNYVVILSKHPIEQHGTIPFPDYWNGMPLRSHLFVRLMRPFGFSKVRNRGGVFADIRVPHFNTLVRVFDVHLVLMQPKWRLAEFERAMEHRTEDRPMIVCGDFNILEAPHITLLNWLFGGSLLDILLFHRERNTIEQRFKKYHLKNALRGKMTHPFSRSQLDHILVSDSLSIKNTHVFTDRIGSDHCPVTVEIS